MSSASVTLKALGLQTSPNQLETPPGSLTEASNVVIRDSDIISQRRGYVQYGQPFGSSSDTASQLMGYQDRILRYWSDTLSFDTGTQDTSGNEIFNDFNATIEPAQEGLRIKSIESNGNLYFTTSEGIQKISAKTAGDFSTISPIGAPTDAGIITPAGGVKAVDLQASVVYTFGNQTGFLPPDSTVAYRVVWGYNDANQNLVLGTPSQRAVVVNSLLTTTLQDFNIVLGALDNLDQPGSLINDGNYASELGLPANASASDLYNAELLLASKLDTDILYANQTSSAPLQISTADLDNGNLSVNFSSGNPSLYFIPGHDIYLNGFTYTNSSGTSDASITNGINEKQVVGSTFSRFQTTGNLTAGNAQVTDVVTKPDVSGSLAGTFWDIYSANNVKQYYVWYNVSGAGNDPSISGKTGIRVNINTNDTANTVALNTTAAINSQASADFTAVNTGGPSAVIDITNTKDGPSLAADSGTSGFTVTTTTPGTSGNVITGVASTSGVVPGAHITDTDGFIPAGTYVISSTFSTITISNNVTSSASGDTLNFDAGLLIASSLTGTITTSGSATINDYTFESITQPTIPSNPATNTQLLSLQQYLSAIIVALQNLPSSVVPSNLQIEFLSGLDVTNSVNVELQITIPFNVTNYDFFQIYRSDIATATGVAVLQNLTPDDEDALVYEAFPTAQQLAARSIRVLDITPDLLRGANLYTNEASGVGIAQAYDLPPFALDINRYKNVTFFANTKTLQRLPLNLIGVIKMVTDYANGLNSHTFTSGNVNTATNTITITNHGYVNTQSVEFHNPTPSNLPSGLIQSQTYYILNATPNTFQLQTLAAPNVPVVLGTTGSGTSTVYNQLPKLVITNGTTTNVYNFILGVNQITNVTTTPASTLNQQGTSSYFFINNTNNVTQYYIWYQVVTVNNITNISVGSPTTITTSSPHGLTTGNSITISGSNSIPIVDGTHVVTVTGANTFTIPITVTTAGNAGTFGVSSTDPAIPGLQGIRVVVNSTDSSAQVATKTNNVINLFIQDFTSQVNSSTVTIENTSPGAAVHASDGPVGHATGFTITTPFPGVGEDESLHNVLLANLVSVGQSIDETAQSLVRIINQNNSEIVNAYYLSSSGSVPGQIELEDRSLSDNPFYVMGNNADTGASFSPNISPENFIIANTATNPTVIQSATPHGMINGDQVVIINSNSTPSIDGLYNITYIDPTHFSIPVIVSVAGNRGSFEKASDALFSNNEARKNRIYYSVINQPDAVPLVNFFDVGSQDQAIIRIMPIRDSLFVFKQDGLWRVSGLIAPFTTDLFDSSCIVVAPDSVAVSNNMIFAWTTRGIVSVTEGGVNNISNNNINNIVKPLSSATYPAFSTATWGLGYESDNSYLVSTVVNPTDTSAKIIYRYDQITNTWTSYDKNYLCGVINEADDKMYAGPSDLNVIEQERKSFTRLDYADRQYPLTLTPNNYFGTLMTFLTSLSTPPINDGDVLLQTQYLTIYQFNQTLLKLDFDPGVEGGYFANLEAMPGDNLRTDIVKLAHRLDSDPGTSFKSYFSGIDTKSGSISNISISNPTIITTSSPHGLQNNRVVTISGSNSNVAINDTYQVTVIDSTHFSVPVNVIYTAGNSGTFATIDNDFRDIQACYNYIINELNLDSGPFFSNYNLSNGVTEIESIIINVNTIKKQLTVNLSLPYIQGPLTVFKAINSSITYSPITFGDPLGLKHVNEATLMFANKAFTSATLNFSSDIIPSFTSIPFSGDGNGIFGYSGNNIGFGSNFFGGLSHGSPFRTFIPLVNQRCRYLIPQFQHGIAREIWEIYGLTLNGSIGQSTRTTR